MQVSEKFTASNGVEVKAIPANGVVDGLELTPSFGKGQTVFEEEIQALREFFLHERDQELGRWRWPENPEFVVYPKGTSEAEPDPGVRVVHEVSGRSRDIGREVVGACDATVSRFGKAAQAYFDAHPLPKPAWHDAKPGEVWLMQTEETEYVMVAYMPLDDVRFRLNDRAGNVFDPDSPVFTGGRRIWPEAVES